ncbi:hypothetical protein RHGRI_018937 [Rhododendron griersonianum]|uniref:Uncharacterized protein n=1 Tax=Rhododendron griersonianum TaxID=479676 RepID=A0AAV6JG41_9ERIC|nr:hypothetical protein RHGRI_018937 [Rhododendron griersonianum]
MVDLRCTLNIHVGGKVVRGSQSEYLNGVIAEMKIDPDSFTFYEFIHPRNLLPGFFTVNDGLITTHRPHLHFSSPLYGE